MFADQKILVALYTIFIILDEQLKEIYEIIPEELHPCEPEYILALADSLDKNHFLLVLYTKVQPECKHHYNGFRMKGVNSWVTESCFSSDKDQIMLQDPAEKSILCENEEVWSLVEVAKERLVIHFANKDILLTKGWEPTQRVIDPDAGNI